MNRSVRSIVVLVLAALGAPSMARAAVDCTVREPKLRHVCDGGVNASLRCDPDETNLPDPLKCSVKRPAEDTQCPGADCVIDFIKGATFNAIFTVAIDENVSNANGDPAAVGNVVAVTVLLDLGKLGTLAQTYQDVSAADLSSLTSTPADAFGVPLSEQLLRNEATTLLDNKPRIVNDLIFRSNEAEMADALRTLLGVGAGVPVVTKVSSVRFTDGPTGLATVLRMKIKGAFVNP